MNDSQTLLSTIKQKPVTAALLIIFVIIWGVVIYLKLADGFHEIGFNIGKMLAT